MSQHLHDLFEDFVDVPSTAVGSDPHRALVIGTRRRLRRQGAASVLTLVIIALAFMVGADYQRHQVQPADGPTGSADRYTTRILRPMLGIRTLPSAPGPVAAVVDRVKEHTTYDEPLGWFVVSQTGRLWELPNKAATSWTPSLSPDGSHLGYLAPGTGYITHDLTTGATKTYPNIVGSTDPQSASSYFFSPQTPSFWAPDNNQLLLPAVPLDDTARSGAVLLGPDGELSYIAPLDNPSFRHPIGWIDDDHLAWITESELKISLLVTDLQGGSTRIVPLGNLRPGDLLSQWAGSVSPDGSMVAVAPRGSHSAVATFYSSTTGDVAQTNNQGPDLEDACGLIWRGNEPVFPTISTTEATIIVDRNLNPLVQADPRLATRCSVWSSTALAGTPQRNLTSRLFDTSTSQLAWRWREWTLGALIAATVAAAGAGAGAARSRRRYRAHRANRPA